MALLFSRVGIECSHRREDVLPLFKKIWGTWGCCVFGNFPRGRGEKSPRACLPCTRESPNSGEHENVTTKSCSCQTVHSQKWPFFFLEMQHLHLILTKTWISSFFPFSLYSLTSTPPVCRHGPGPERNIWYKPEPILSRAQA